MRSAAPAPDADRAAVLSEAGDPSLCARSLRRRLLPRTVPSTPGTRRRRAGGRVLDLCLILAGPICGRTLAEFGADVIKIDNPIREGGIASHLDVNRGKRSVLLDLKTEAGKEVL